MVTWGPVKMCKISKVWGAGSLSLRGSKNISTQVREEVKLLLLACRLGLNTTGHWGLREKRREVMKRKTGHKVLRRRTDRFVVPNEGTKVKVLVCRYLVGWSLGEMQGFEGLGKNLWGATGTASRWTRYWGLHRGNHLGLFWGNIPANDGGTIIELSICRPTWKANLPRAPWGFFLIEVFDLWVK